jgi:hypothetical protein
VQSVPLGQSWYGLRFDLSLGTLGGVGPSGPLTASFALIWSPVQRAANPGDAPVMVGLKLPGFSAGGDLPLMSQLKLKVPSRELVSGGLQASTGGPPYVLRLNGISLSFFGISFPPGVTFDFYLWGDPKNPGSSALSWFGDMVVK